MKAMKLPKELESFLDVAETAEEETLVFTRKKRPVAALVSLRKVDRESLAEHQSAIFENHRNRRKKFGRKTISLAAWKSLLAAPNKKDGANAKRRSSCVRHKGWS
jgi:hypothetical protein